jgi:hypothetical protein
MARGIYLSCIRDPGERERWHKSRHYKLQHALASKRERYDLLGVQHSPLRLLTRAVTYSVVFGIGHGLGLGLFFGPTSGTATGITMSIELIRAARGLDHYSLLWETLFSAIRGFAFGAGLHKILRMSSK